MEKRKDTLDPKKRENLHNLLVLRGISISMVKDKGVCLIIPLDSTKEQEKAIIQAYLIRKEDQSIENKLPTP